MEDDKILKTQIEYYRARAGEYDEWFYREGRYHQDTSDNRAWFDELRYVSEELGRFCVRGDILELACGTGIWTSVLISRAATVTAVDASPEVMRINEAKMAERRPGNASLSNVQFIQADLFDWRPNRTYDVVFFGFWLSHVPPERFESFWNLVRAALAPGGRFFFIDSLPDRSSSAFDHDAPNKAESIQRRRLNDGSTYEIVKVYYEPGELETKLYELGFTAQVKKSGRYFLYGSGNLQAPNAQSGW